MSAPWTQDRVLSLAADAASASAGQALGNARKWQGLGQSGRAVWGLCQGSGKDPYQARVDLSDPAFKCSCPSRKFPCKHGIGLMLLYAKEATVFKQGAEPGWVSEWIDSRTERTEKKEQRAKEAADRPPDPEAQARRAAARDARAADGARECRVWLEDLVRRGLAAAQQERESFWDRAAARMVDAQAPGLARLIGQLPGVIASGKGWERRTMDRLGRLHLLLRGAERLEQLQPDLASDIRVALGRAQPKEEALAGASLADRWWVLAQLSEEEERLRVRRTWLVGRASGRRALVLDFAAGAQPLDTSLVAGTEFDGELAFYPSRLPQRALVKSRGGAAAAFSGRLPESDLETELAGYAGDLAVVPWLERWPLLLSAVTPVPGADRWLIADSTGRGLPLRPGFAGAWRLLAISRGRPLSLMGEWDGESLTPLAAWDGEAAAHVDLAPRWAA